MVLYAISEHVEYGGVHSGDASMVLPSDVLPMETKVKLKNIMALIGKALNISGPYNIQCLHKDGKLKVIETNLRASRSMPFVSKTLDLDFVRTSALIFLGKPVRYDPRCDTMQGMDGSPVFVYSTKVAQFSYKRLPGADPLRGVEMASTGEVACFDTERNGAYLMSLAASWVPALVPGSRIWIAIHDIHDTLDETSHKWNHVLVAKKFHSLGFTIRTTAAAAKVLSGLNVPAEAVEGLENEGDVVADLRGSNSSAFFDLKRSMQESWYRARRAAIDYGIMLITDENQALQLAESMTSHRYDYRNVRSYEEWMSFRLQKLAEAGRPINDEL
jgi:carbamoyl-phosphate synthase/aspartate carbamoyltransferase